MMILIRSMTMMQFLSFLPNSSIHHNLTLQWMQNPLRRQKLQLSLPPLPRNTLLHRILLFVLVLLTNVVVTLQ